MQDPAPTTLAHKLPTEDTILREVHVRRKDIRTGTMHLLAEEVLLKRALTSRVVLQGVVAVCAEGTGQHGDVAKDGLEGLVENVGHLVLEVLGGD